MGPPQADPCPSPQWPAVLSAVVLEQERMLPVLLDLLDGGSELQNRALTGLLRNLSRHCRDKESTGGFRETSV